MKFRKNIGLITNFLHLLTFKTPISQYLKSIKISKNLVITHRAMCMNSIFYLIDYLAYA